MARIEDRSRALDDRLLASQDRFQQDATAGYTTLARDVGVALQSSLAAGARAAGDSIRPVMEAAMAQIAQDQTRRETERLQAWSTQLQAMADGLDTQWKQAASHMDALARDTTARVAAMAGQLATSVDALTQQTAASTERLTQQTAANADALAQRLAANAQTLADQMDAGTLALAKHVTASAETFTHHMAEGAAALTRQLDASAQNVAQTWQTQMDALRAEEAARGDAAVARLGELQAAVAQHLATLGNALEAPLARLLQTASEVPQAASGVLVQLRQEMAHLSGQENAALAERTALVERLSALMQTVEDAARQSTQMAVQAQAQAVELSSWGEAFGQSVELFHTGNEKLAAALQQVESAISRSTARSDEQLAYYVAQAREVIDLSITAQHGVLDRLRTLGGPAGRKASHAAA